MKLTGELKEKVEAVESDMEKKAIIAHAGNPLTDDELNTVTGGNFNPGDRTVWNDDSVWRW